jgi:hypothetical protein
MLGTGLCFRGNQVVVESCELLLMLSEPRISAGPRCPRMPTEADPSLTCAGSQTLHAYS